MDLSAPVTYLVGDCRACLKDIPDGIIQTCITSPPYWGLRDYGTPPQEWADGWSGNLGLEPTPQQFVAHLVEVFREVRRVLRPDGTLWLNLGDSYASSPPGNKTKGVSAKSGLHGVNGVSGVYRETLAAGHATKRNTVVGNLKAKDLVGIPWMAAFALREPYHVGPIKQEVDRAWLAAMLDSDGCLGIRVQKAMLDRCANETFIPYLTISQTDTAALEHCARITGMGSVRVKSRPTEDSRGIRSTRVFYTWRLDGQQASRVIRDVYPYLLIKKAQAQVVYAMNDSLKWGRPSRSLPVPPDVMRRRRELYTLVKALNQRQSVTLPALPEVPPSVEPGWYLRMDNIWAKGVSGQKELTAILREALRKAHLNADEVHRTMAMLEPYVGNCMPESVKDRTTRSHEYMFLLTKSSSYYYDSFAMQEGAVGVDRVRNDRFGGNKHGGETTKHSDGSTFVHASGRNRRSVWLIPTRPFKGAHFAVFPPHLVEGPLLASTPDFGSCAMCGTPYRRVVRKRKGPKVEERLNRDQVGAAQQTRALVEGSDRYMSGRVWAKAQQEAAELEALEAHKQACGADASGEYHGTAQKDYAPTLAQDPSATKARILARMAVKETLGWESGCTCVGAAVVPSLVLDPFGGSGTVAAVAELHGRRAISIDLNDSYTALHELRQQDVRRALQPVVVKKTRRKAGVTE